jgi:hypothetical protein
MGFHRPLLSYVLNTVDGHWTVNFSSCLCHLEIAEDSGSLEAGLSLFQGLARQNVKYCPTSIVCAAMQ